jgi:hypothetical protein
MSTPRVLVADSIVYAVYPPPLADLPFLAVIVWPDGKVQAKQFPTEEEASACCRAAARVRHPGKRH